MINHTEKQEEEEIPRDSSIKFGKLRIVKNAFVLCLVVFVTYTAFDCLYMLQSTLNHKNGIGVTCQAIGYGCHAISSLLLPKYAIKRLGCKLALVFSMCFFLPYISSNLYPHWSFMAPTAVLLGVAASVLWGALCQYMNEIAAQYAAQNTTGDGNEKKRQEPKSEIKTISDKATPRPEMKFALTDRNAYNNRNVSNEANKTSTDDLHISDNSMQKENSDFTSNVNLKNTSFSSKSVEAYQKVQDNISSEQYIESITAKFFGMFGLAYLSSHMWSNVMSYFILQNNAPHSNALHPNSSCVCGADFCNVESECFVHNLQEPDLENRYLLIGISLALVAVSITIMAVFMDSLDDGNKNTAFSMEFLLATGKQLKKLNQILLTPISFYTGMMQGFYVGDFNSSFTGCAWGISHVALVSACYGAACGFSSPVSGYLIKLTGRIPVISFATLANVAAQILMLHWKPSAENPAIFFVFAALWGTTLGIIFSQVKAMYGFLFKKDQEAAFAAYHVWHSLGFTLSFAYSNHLCTYIKIYALVSVLIVGFIGYLSVEIILRLKLKKSIK